MCPPIGPESCWLTGLLSVSCSLSELSEDEVEDELDDSDNFIFLAAVGSTTGSTIGVLNMGIEGPVLEGGGAGGIGTGDAAGSVLTTDDFLADFLLIFFVFSIV